MVQINYQVVNMNGSHVHDICALTSLSINGFLYARGPHSHSFCIRCYNSSSVYNFNLTEWEKAAETSITELEVRKKYNDYTFSKDVSLKNI